MFGRFFERKVGAEPFVPEAQQEGKENLPLTYEEQARLTGYCKRLMEQKSLQDEEMSDY